MDSLPEELAIQRLITPDNWFGYEFYLEDVLADWVLANAEVLRGSRNAHLPPVVDVGGASGFKAMSTLPYT